ncbi:hypothetical protein G3O08_08580 [Cryomorpha ignava]|uniref:Uncharacterized protein n=1 Tax=Cryomorpha ignava TaxID=101383 RepID=A0A7K3WS71_9FLAO|nr:hypothetical protein [Cryomorpha ignava]NEN23555.1 hypothetical protein [Cryomorpha ignava]
MLIFLVFGWGCGLEDSSGKDESLKDVKNESVITSIENIEKDTLTEDVIQNSETKKEVEKLKSERVEKLKDKVSKSSYKGFSDSDIKIELQRNLESYKESCDSTLYNRITDQMAYDAVLSFFKERESAFSRAYFKDLQRAHRDCKK